MKYAFIQVEKANHPVGVLCRTMGVSRSGFYAWCTRKPCERAQKDAVLKVHIRAKHRASGGTRGSPGIHGDLHQDGHRVGRTRVARLMREDGLVGVPQKRFKVTTDSNHSGPVAPNLLQDRPAPSRPDEVWAADITYVRTWEGWLYVATVIDVHSRRVIGWSCATHMRAELPLDALQMAIGQRRPPPGLIHHSDRGSQYASRKYRKLLAKHGIVQSMSRRGNCYDNALAESFFGTLKTELVHRYAWPTRRRAAEAISKWIATYYNSQRGHSALGYRSPMAFEKGLAQQRSAA